MLYTKTNPVGIDWHIQKLQTFLHDSLITTWGITSAKYEAYGRCYRNKRDGAYIAEVYTGSGYKEVYWQDGLAAISFFGVTDKIKVDVGESSNVHLIFFVDLSKLKPAITHRADEEVRADVASICNQYGFELVSIEQWAENVLREYSRKGLTHVDMHPVHCFRLNLKINYQINKNC